MCVWAEIAVREEDAQQQQVTHCVCVSTLGPGFDVDSGKEEEKKE